ncbi:MAG: C39 family peptidase [Clostridia bacterium]|nr:C39 family peptidase [Clostridia bacterium]
MGKSFHTYLRRAAALLLTLCLLPWGILTASADDTDTGAPLPTCYQQNDPRWGHLEQLAPGGCGILSLVNAVHFLTGNFIDPVGLAAYARSIDAYYGSVGGGTARWVLYHQLDDYEKKYGFEVTMTGKDAGAKHQSLIDHLASGGTAVAHVKGHFIALCGYDRATDSMLVYDPAATPDRQTTVAPLWKTTDFLTTHPRMTVDWFCLIKRTGSTEVELEGVREQGKNREIITSARVGQGTTDLTPLKGTVKHRSPLETLFYVMDYDYTTVYETSVDLGGKRTADFTLPLDVSGWDMGTHTLRLSARGTDGSVTDIAEYTVFVGDGKDGYDPATGTLTVNMSSFADQKGVIRSPQSLGAEGYTFRSTTGTALYLGHLDLSRYTAVCFYYSAVEAFFGSTDATISLSSASDTVAEAVLPPADLPLSETQTVTVDLTACDYSGELWLSIGHPTRKMCYLREIRFYEGEIPADTEESVDTAPDTPAETPDPETPDTAEPTFPEETAPTDTQAPETGCTATLPAVFFVSLALSSAALLPRRHRRPRRG